ncbi:MAG: cell division protein ZapE [Proteobacteria bacterium]|nr:cell division protein ZapE [Pseudomonadota bacterium]
MPTAPAPAEGSALAAWMRRHASAHGYTLDPAQEATLPAFRRVFDGLAERERAERSLIRRLARRRSVPGLYLFGGVGRGKSFLMDTFFAAAPVARKKRIHFHRFMQEIHHRLRDLQGRANPMREVARLIAKDARLLCLDEFHVTDITDAMLMRNLLEGLVEEGVVLVTTSNAKPDDLYRNGLQRSGFLPAIELLKQHLEVIEVESEVDYRLRALHAGGVYHTPIDAAVEARLEAEFQALSGEPGETTVPIEVDDRVFIARRIAGGTAWFDFRMLCDGPRGKSDYIELARRFHTVIVSGVPELTSGERDVARRFVWLIDEFYDRRVKLILSAEVTVERLFVRVPLDDVYKAQKGSGEFDRTVSRLVEMQSVHYLAEPHLP